jgi:hypothetical protein
MTFKFGYLRIKLLHIISKKGSQNSSVIVVTRLRPGRRRNRAFDFWLYQNLSFLFKLLIGFWVHPATYTVAMGRGEVLSPGVKMTTQLHPPPKIRVRAAMILCTHTF